MKRTTRDAWGVDRDGYHEVPAGTSVCTSFHYEACDGTRIANCWTAGDHRSFDIEAVSLEDVHESGSTSPAMLAVMLLALVPVGMVLSFLALLAGSIAGAVA